MRANQLHQRRASEKTLPTRFWSRHGVSLTKRISTSDAPEPPLRFDCFFLFLSTLVCTHVLIVNSEVSDMLRLSGSQGYLKKAIHPGVHPHIWMTFWAANPCGIQILEVNSILHHPAAEISRTRKTLMIY